MVLSLVVPRRGGSTRVDTSDGKRLAALGDVIAVVVLLAAYPVLNDLRSMLTTPYWLDEAWVALSVRFPLSDLSVTTSSTPLGWSFLLRLVPDGNDLRLVPLAFQLVTIVAAYALGRMPAWPSRALGRLAGMVCGAVVLLLPAQQVAHDLKQYSADGALTLGLLLLCAWTEQRWSRRRLAVLAGVAAIGMLFSQVVAFVAPCVIGGLALAALTRKQWRRLVEVLVAGACAGLGIMVIYLGVARRASSSGMRDYWAAFFPTLTGLPGYVFHRATELSPLLGVPALVLVVFVIVGALTLFRLGRAGTAIAVVLVPLAAMLLGVARIYPLLDRRTSHYLVVMAVAVAGIGLAGAVVFAVGLWRRVPAGRAQVALAAGVCVVLLAVFGTANRSWYRYGQLHPEDIRSQVDYVAGHRSPGDIILVNAGGVYGFSFYWRQDQLKLVSPYPDTVGWSVDLPADPNVVFIRENTESSIQHGVEQALTLASQHGPGARVWLVRTHVVFGEGGAWRKVLAGYQVDKVTNTREPLVTVAAK